MWFFLGPVILVKLGYLIELQEELHWSLRPYIPYRCMDPWGKLPEDLPSLADVCDLRATVAAHRSLLLLEVRMLG